MIETFKSENSGLFELNELSKIYFVQDNVLLLFALLYVCKIVS